eukprot:915167-Pelagomonas_calceolata.AAC.1
MVSLSSAGNGCLCCPSVSHDIASVGHCIIVRACELQGDMAVKLGITLIDESDFNERLGSGCRLPS